MAALDYKVYRVLMKQDKHVKSLGYSPVTQSISGPSFNFHSYNRNRQTFIVCLATVLCYGVGNIPTIFVHRILKITGDDWVGHLSNVLRAAGSHLVNSFIYRTFDKKLHIRNLMTEDDGIGLLAYVLQVVESYSVNPLLCGILDKNLHIRNFCRKRAKRTDEIQLNIVYKLSKETKIVSRIKSHIINVAKMNGHEKIAEYRTVSRQHLLLSMLSLLYLSKLNLP